MRIVSKPRAGPSRLREAPSAYRAELPGPLYCDSSALVTLYISEPGSADFSRQVAGRRDVIISDLGVTELVSALARRVRERGFTRDIVERAHRAVLEHLDGGIYLRVDLTREVHRRAEQFLVSLPAPLRAADALHLALAVSSRAASIASFDVRLQRAARAAGLVTYPGERRA